MPSIAQVKFDPVLTNLSIAYGPTGHIATDILPVTGVKLEDGIYYIYDKSKFNTPSALRAPRAAYRQVDWSVTRASYHTEEYGLELPIDDRERNNSVGVLDLDETSTEILTDNLLNAQEKRVTSLVLSTANVTQNTTLAGANQWSDVSGGDPIGVSITAQTTIQAATGMMANSVVMGYQVWNKLMTNAKIKAEMVDGEQLTKARLAQLFQVQNVYVGTVLTATNKKGQTVTLGDAWGKDVLFFHKAGKPALRRPSFGYTIQVQDRKVFRYRKTSINSDIIRVNHNQVEKLVAPELGYLVKAAIA